MRKVIYSMGVSLDGYIAGPGGEIDFAAPDEELHRFHNEQTRELGVHLCGRRLYETMVPWEITDEREMPEVGREFAQIWKQLPKIVFSRTLTSVEGNAALATTDLGDEVTRLKQQPGGDIALGGAGLAAEAMKLDLIDEYRLFVNPVAIGGGTPFFSAQANRLEVRLLETRVFGEEVVYLRYARS